MSWLVKQLVLNFSLDGLLTLINKAQNISSNRYLQILQAHSKSEKSPYMQSERLIEAVINT